MEGESASVLAATPDANEDPFQRADFNVVHYLNSRFPNEDSLHKLEPAIEGLNGKVSRIDAHILQAVHQQSSAGSKARRELTNAKASIAELLTAVGEIRHKAGATESLVQDICRDIKKLDTAKKHLTATITGLRRLAMLAAAVDQLQLAAERQEYDEAAHLVGAVQELCDHFRGTQHVPRVSEMRSRLAALERSLRVSALREFELLGEEPPSPALLDRLRACCTVAAALGPAARDELADAVCRREMSVYTQIFGTVGETARLDRTVNRYKWLLRRLEQRREVWAIFPPDWRMQQLLCVTFCSITKTAMAEILDDKVAELPHHVEALLKAVEATHIFEAELARRFGEAFAGTTPRRSHTEEDADDGDFAAKDAADEVRRRYSRRKSSDAHAQQGQDDTGVFSSPVEDRETRQHQAAAEAVARATFRGSISPVFYPYLKFYVEQVERQLLWGVEQMIKAETWLPLSPEQPILKSSNAITDAVRAEVRECRSRVAHGPTLFDLSSVFKHAYRAYATALVARLPKTASGGTSGIAVLGASDWQVKLGEGDVELVCLLVTTAEHCMEMVAQLARALSGWIDPPLSLSIDFSSEEDEFAAVSAEALSILLLGLETKLEAGFTAMIRRNWGAVEAAGDHSDYVSTMSTAFADVGSRASKALPANQFRFFCDKLLRSLGPRLAEAVLRCRRISDAGCQQLRLDVEAIKGGLLALARTGPPTEDSMAWAQSFAADVGVQLGRAEAVLKVVASPPSAMVDTFLELLPHASATDFQRIAELKSLKKIELAAVLEEYIRRVRDASKAAPVAAASRKPVTAASGSASAASGPVQSSSTTGHFAPTAPSPAQPTSAAAGSSSAATRLGQDMAARFKAPALNMQAARASVSDMRETMGRTFKSFRFGKHTSSDGNEMNK